MNKQKNMDPIGKILIALFFLCLAVAAYFSHKSIDYKILNKLESQPLILPTPISTQIKK